MPGRRQPSPARVKRNVHCDTFRPPSSGLVQGRTGTGWSGTREPRSQRRLAMHTFKQGMATVMLVMSLGLVMPSLFGGSVSADISRNHGIQPMVLKCDLDGNDATGANGYEFASEVTSIDLGDQ